MAQTSNEESRLEIKREWRGYFVTTPKGVIHLLSYLVTDCVGEFQLHAHSALTWATPEKLMKYDLAPADIPIARELIRRHNSHHMLR